MEQSERPTIERLIANENILFGFVLRMKEDEVFEGYSKLLTGIEKVNAVCELTKAIH